MLINCRLRVGVSNCESTLLNETDVRLTAWSSEPGACGWGEVRATLIRALLVGSGANFYSAIESGWRKLDGVGPNARGPECEACREEEAPAESGSMSAWRVLCPAWAKPD